MPRKPLLAPFVAKLISPMDEGFVPTLLQRARAILNLFSPNASSYPFATRQGMFQDSAGTVPAVVATDPIGKVTDAIGTNHATQTVAGNRPTLERGLWNLLTYSQDFSNAAWGVQGTASKSGSNLLTPAINDQVIRTASLPSGAITEAFILSGSGTCSIYGYNGTDGIIGTTQVTLTATPTLYVATFVPTVTGTNAYFGRLAGDTATSITFGGGAVFQGTLTADQILQQGGIPLTTSAAGSNPTAGPYWLQGNGTNQYMQLASIPLSGTADHAMIACVNCNGTVNVQAVFEQTGATAGIRFGVNANTGFAYGEWTNDAGLTKTLSGAADVRNQIVVVIAVQRGNKRDVWLNNVQIATDTTAMGAFTFTSAWLLRSYGVLCWPGSAYCVDLVSGTVTDEQLVVLGKAAAQRAGLTL